MQKELGRDVIFVLNLDQKDRVEEIYEKEQTFHCISKLYSTYCEDVFGEGASLHKIDLSSDPSSYAYSLLRKVSILL